MLTYKWAKNKMENIEGLNHLSVEITPPAPPSLENKPVAILLVIDRSGSMDGSAEDFRIAEGSASKLDFVKNASEKLVDMMRDGDQIGIVSFDHIARIEYPLSPITRNERFIIKDRIRAMDTGGTTNVSDGLEQAYRQISKDLLETHHVKMILLSDGEANEGITEIDDLATIVKGYRNGGTSISTIGVGTDYNSFFMESIATSSGAMFYNLNSMKKLDSILTAELQTLASLTMKSTKLSIQLPEGLQRRSNLNDYTEDANGTIYIGNVFEEQEIIIEFFTDEKGTKTGSKNMTLTLEFTDHEGTKNQQSTHITLPLVEDSEMDDVQINHDVVKSVQLLMESKVKREAIRHFEDHDFEAVHSIDTSSFEKLSSNYDFEIKESMMEIEELKETLSHDIKQEERSLIKDVYASNLQASRRKRRN